MKLFPIIPIWIMIIICLLSSIYVIKRNNKKINQLLIILLLFIINLRIMIPSNNSLILTNNLDVLFVIDTTISMNAEDYNGKNTRLSAVKNDCSYIVKKLVGARFSIITFNNKTNILTPYTKDYNITKEAIDIIEPIDELHAKGSSLNTPLESIIESLKSSEEKEDRIKILFFISDGEITDDSKLKSYKELSKYVDNGAILGYGTTKGGYMKVKSLWNDTIDYLEDTSDYSNAISKIDENNLKQIANDINIDYINMNKQSNINSKLREIDNLIDKGIESSDKSTYDDIYYFFILPLLILIMIEFNKFRRVAI